MSTVNLNYCLGAMASKERSQIVERNEGKGVCLFFPAATNKFLRAINRLILADYCHWYMVQKHIL
jgi:hypothetical protein